MINAGENIRKMANERYQKARDKFVITCFLFVTPILLFVEIDNLGLAVLILVVSWVCGFRFMKQFRQLLKEFHNANQGAQGEESTALVLSELVNEGWKAEHGVVVPYWGDVDHFVCSPNQNCFVIDTKTDGGTVFFDGKMLVKKYGNEVKSFARKKDILKSVKGQAVTMRNLKNVKYVTPVLCFDRANLDIKTIDNKIAGVYVLAQSSLIRVLKKLDKNLIKR